MAESAAAGEAAGTTPAASRFAVRELTPADLEAWRALVARSEDGSAYALPEYLDALCGATDSGYRLLGVFLDGKLAGGVPLFERRARAGVVVGNRTLLYYNGIVLDLPARKFHSDRVTQELAALEALAAAIEVRSYAHVLLHHRSTLMDVRAFQARGWDVKVSYTYVLPLGDTDAQWACVDQNLRRLIQRCEREGVTYREDDDIDALFRLHLQTHERKGAPLYLPRQRFHDYFRRVADAGLARLGHAVYDGKVIASQLMLTGPHRVAHTVCAGADEDYLRMGASGFLRWHAAIALARDGYVANDLTDAGLNPVTRFKSQLGAKLTPTLSVVRSSWLHRCETAVQRWRRR